MNYIIHENQRGLLFKNGAFVKMLGSGKHTFWGNAHNVLLMDMGQPFAVEGMDLSIFLKDSNLNKELSIIDVAEETFVLHYVNNRFQKVLSAGMHAFFNVFERHDYVVISTKTPEVSPDFPKHLFPFLPRKLYTEINVASYEKAPLYFDNQLVALLEPGTYHYWNNGTTIEARPVDTRLLQLELLGQEILTLDKVGLRINFVLNYKITDYVKIHTEVEDIQRQLHVAVQLILRELIGKHRLDALLENKDRLAEAAFQALKEKEGNYFIQLFDAGIKDIILPGEIREIMNTVLIAEKRAQANVITRREEVASTRSLLNTAKLMEENATLYKLKELELVEKICQNVGMITVAGGNGLLAEITNLVKGA